MHGTPTPEEANVTVPTLYTTGAEDNLVRPAVVNTSFVRSVNARPRVFVELADADHFEPTNPRPGHMRLNPYAAAFLLCHVAGDAVGCCAEIEFGAPNFFLWTDAISRGLPSTRVEE